MEGTTPRQFDSFRRLIVRPSANSPLDELQTTDSRSETGKWTAGDLSSFEDAGDHPAADVGPVALNEDERELSGAELGVDEPADTRHPFRRLTQTPSRPNRHKTQRPTARSFAPVGEPLVNNT